jgi:hypothetical protein
MMAVETAHRTTIERQVPRREVVGAWLLLAGVSTLLLGMMWDGQWHVDVGPDTFFTAPHLLLYASTAINGLTALIVVLRNSWSTASDTPAAKVFGVFRAPWPFLIAGLGAAGTLLYGSTDLWWHELYGFDIAIAETPTHVGLGWTWLVQAAAAVMAFGVLRETRSGRCGLALAIVVGSMASAAPAASIVRLALGWLDGLSVDGVGNGALAACGVGLIGALLRSARWTAAAGLLFLGALSVVTVFSFIATQWYADAIGQPMREYVLGVPIALFQFPPTFAVVVFGAAGVIWWSARKGWSPSLVLSALGAFAGLVMTGFYVLTDNQTNAVLSLLVAAVLGAGVGWLGCQLGNQLRQLTPHDRMVVA